MPVSPRSLDSLGNAQPWFPGACCECFLRQRLAGNFIGERQVLKIECGNHASHFAAEFSAVGSRHANDVPAHHPSDPLENRMKTNLSVSTVLVAVLGFASVSSVNACSNAESADAAKSVTVATTTVDSSPFYATDVDARTTADLRPRGAVRGANEDTVVKRGAGPAKMFQLRDAAGG